MEETKITINELRILCMKVFKKHGLSDNDAETIFQEYLDGEARGRLSHGFSSFNKFVTKVGNGKFAKHKIEKEGGCWTMVNGMGSLGQLVCKEVMGLTIEKAKKNGIALTGIYNMHTYLMPGTFARMAANNDMIALIFNTGGKPRIAPFGSIDPIFGTNPIAVGIPTNGLPIVLDMATSERAMGEVRIAKSLGRKLESNWALDKDGHPTNDPEKASEGAVLPFGGYKGSSIAFIVQALTSPLGNMIKDENGKPGRGFLFIVIDPAIFTDIKSFKVGIDEIIDEVKNARKKEGVDEIFYPGERSERLKQENLKKGYLMMRSSVIDEIRGMV